MTVLIEVPVSIEAREVQPGQSVRFTYAGPLETVLSVTDEGSLVTITSREHGENWINERTLISSHPVYAEAQETQETQEEG